MSRSELLAWVSVALMATVVIQLVLLVSRPSSAAAASDESAWTRRAEVFDAGQAFTVYSGGDAGWSQEFLAGSDYPHPYYFDDLLVKQLEAMTHPDSMAIYSGSKRGLVVLWDCRDKSISYYPPDGGRQVLEKGLVCP